VIIHFFDVTVSRNQFDFRDFERANYMASARQIAKGALVKIGARLSLTVLNRLTSALNYLYTGRWMRNHNFHAAVRVNDRVKLIDVIAGPIADQEVLYLEFGVWKGDATRRWSQLLKNKTRGFMALIVLRAYPKIGTTR
jgi:hypothetical protein